MLYGFLNHGVLLIAAALVSAGVAYALFRRLLYGAVAFAAGLLVSADLAVDYVFAYGLTWHPHEFVNFEFFQKSGKIILLLHSWDLVMVLGFLAAVTGYRSFFLAVVLGIFGHLVVDQLVAPGQPLAYFFTFRLLHNFSASEIGR